MASFAQPVSDETVFAHLTDNILNLSTAHPIRFCLCFNGYDKLGSFLSIVENEIESLRYVLLPTKDTVNHQSTGLLMGHVNLLRHFFRWIDTQSNTKGGPLDNLDLLSLARDEFNLYRRFPGDHFSSLPEFSWPRATALVTADFRDNSKRENLYTGSIAEVWRMTIPPTPLTTWQPKVWIKLLNLSMKCIRTEFRCTQSTIFLQLLW